MASDVSCLDVEESVVGVSGAIVKSGIGRMIQVLSGGGRRP